MTSWSHKPFSTREREKKYNFIVVLDSAWMGRNYWSKNHAQKYMQQQWQQQQPKRTNVQRIISYISVLYVRMHHINKFHSVERKKISVIFTQKVNEIVCDIFFYFFNIRPVYIRLILALTATYWHKCFNVCFRYFHLIRWYAIAFGHEFEVNKWGKEKNREKAGEKHVNQAHFFVLSSPASRVKRKYCCLLVIFPINCVLGELFTIFEVVCLPSLLTNNDISKLSIILLSGMREIDIIGCAGQFFQIESHNEF